jgi:uncharacterized repeat protein (TIGR01451 family)
MFQPVSPVTAADEARSQAAVLGSADLSLTMSDSPDPVRPGQTLVYTIAVNNSGPDTAENLTVTNILPTGVTYVSASGTGWTCNKVTTNMVICTRPSLAVGLAPYIDLNLQAPAAPGTIMNAAQVSSSSDDANTNNNTDSEYTLVADEADLSLIKTAAPDTVYSGEAITYTLSVSNAGPDAASTVTVTDDLPNGVTYQSASGDGWTCGESGGTVNCTRASLAVGAAPDITISVLAPATGGVIVNAATAAGTSYDPITADNSDTAEVTVEPSADLSLTKTASSDPVKTDETLTYALSVENLGGDPAQDVVVTDVLPAGVAFQSTSGDGWSCSESGGTVTCTRASLAVGAAPDITISVTAPSTEGDVVNTASVSASTHDPASGNNSDMVTVSVSDLLYFFIPLIIK